MRLAILESEARSEREGDLVLVNTHVVAAYPHGGRLTVFDFYRQRRDEVRGVRLLDDFETMVAVATMPKVEEEAAVAAVEGAAPAAVTSTEPELSVERGKKEEEGSEEKK